MAGYSLSLSNVPGCIEKKQRKPGQEGGKVGEEIGDQGCLKVVVVVVLKM